MEGWSLLRGIRPCVLITHSLSKMSSLWTEGSFLKGTTVVYSLITTQNHSAHYTHLSKPIIEVVHVVPNTGVQSISQHPHKGPFAHPASNNTDVYTCVYMYCMHLCNSLHSCHRVHFHKPCTGWNVRLPGLSMQLMGLTTVSVASNGAIAAKLWPSMPIAAYAIVQATNKWCQQVRSVRNGSFIQGMHRADAEACLLGRSGSYLVKSVLRAPVPAYCLAHASALSAHAVMQRQKLEQLSRSLSLNHTHILGPGRDSPTKLPASLY